MRKIQVDILAADRHTVHMNLKRYFKEQNIRIYHLAKAVGIPRTTLRDIVDGRTKIAECRYSTLKKISDYLEIPVDVIVEEDGIGFYYGKNDRIRQLAKNNEAGRTGVCKNTKGGYRAYIQYRHKNIHLGDFKSLGEAVAARTAAEKIVSAIKQS